MRRYENAFTAAVARAVGIDEAEIRAHLKTPEEERGDLSLPCFPFAKRLRQSPAQIAAAAAAKIEPSPMFAAIEAVGPYVNAHISTAHLFASVAPEIRALGERFAGSELGAGGYVVIDYSSPNIAKPLGFHHLRSTMIGNALARIHRALGYRVAGVNFLGDWGKTFGLLAEAFRRSGDRARLEAEGIPYLLELYVSASRMAAEDPAFDAAARAMFKAQEDGDPAALELWRTFRELSLREFQRVYDRLGVSFEFIEGESRYREGMDAVIEEIRRTVGTREDQGALVVDMPYAEGEPPMMLRKSDGATLYATRDVAAARDRFARFAFAKSIYVVGVEQKLHFGQLKRALLAMGHAWADRMTHAHFGRIQGMSTRKGNVVFLTDALDEARDRALAKMREASDERVAEIDAVAEQVGVGGIVFGDLKNLRTSDYTFDWEEILNTKGFTGICVQYAHARCCSILRKGGGAPDPADVDWSLLAAIEEAALVKELARLPAAVVAAAEDLEPSRLARAVYEVARAWNRYQQAGNAERNLRVLCEDPAIRKARLALVDAARIGLARGLDLLGVPAPEAM
ncbi:MAG: arginine--tRNA ligase [Proteobacteria bacterium]|jgi:arginyl-tRNA synthetase|nr:arginine--tRNA ligase [Pseudomonadota bacterium]